MAKKYSTEEYKAFLSQPMSNNFGFSKEGIADWFMAQGGARPVISSYGVTRENLLSTYIPKLEEKLGGFAFFLFYTVTESGGAGNWINHYGRDTGSTGLECLVDDCDYLNQINQEHHPVALSAPEVFSPAVEDESGACQAFYDSLPTGTIGKVFMPSTMAGNAWVWATSWCSANQGGVPYVYFGNPYDTMIDVIKSAGVDPFNLGEQTGNIGGVSEAGKAFRDVTKGNANANISALINNLKKAVLEIFDNQVYDLNHGMHYANDLIKIERTYNNIMKVDLDTDYLDKIFSSVLSKINNLSKSAGIDFNHSPREGRRTPQNNEGQITDIGSKINALRALEGQTIGDGQCYALTSYYLNSITPGYHISYSLGQIPPSFIIGETIRASNIGSSYDWASIGWTVKEPTKENLKTGDIFNVASFVQGIWWTQENGHTGVVTDYDGSTVEITDQNWNNAPVSVRRYDVDSFLYGLTSLVSPP